MNIKLIIADSEKDATMFYATGILISDDFVYLEKNGRKIVYVDDLEYNRAKKETKVDKVINYSEYAKGIDRNSFGNVLMNILKDNKIKKVQVPGNVVTIEPGLYYPEIGGVRIEDLVVVTKTGCKNLTKFPKFLEIK